MHIVNAINMVRAEAERASAKHPPMHSHHEAYAVIREEFEEYWQEVQKGGSKPRDPEALRTELVQTAAMCVRTLTDLCSYPPAIYEARERQ